MIEQIKSATNKAYGKKVLFFAPLVILVVIIGFAFIILSNGFDSVSNKMVTSDYFSMNESKSYASNRGDSSSSIPTVDQKIIKKGSLDIFVKKVDDTVAKIQQIAEGYKGVVDSSKITDRGVDTKYGIITIRVPNENFNSSIQEIKKLAVKINSEIVSSEDVTAQYVDLNARLNSKKSVEQQYVVLLQRANTIDEMVLVSNKLNTVREEIERLQAQINYLSKQISMSSINISMTSEAEVQILGITWRPIVIIKQSFRNLLTSLTGTIDWLIAFAFLLPVLLIRLSILIFIIWVVVKVAKKIFKRFKKDPLSTV